MEFGLVLKPIKAFQEEGWLVIRFKDSFQFDYVKAWGDILRAITKLSILKIRMQFRKVTRGGSEVFLSNEYSLSVLVLNGFLISFKKGTCYSKKKKKNWIRFRRRQLQTRCRSFTSSSLFLSPPTYYMYKFLQWSWRLGINTGWFHIKDSKIVLDFALL